MKDSVKIFNSIIFNFNYIASINIEEESTAIANIFKMIFLIIIILTLLSTALLMLYFPLDINSELSLISLYIFFAILISFVIFSCVVDILLGVHLKRISILMVNGGKIYSNYILSRDIERYLKYSKMLIENLKFNNELFALDDLNSNGDFRKLWHTCSYYNKHEIMEFNVIQSVAASLAGFIKGITGGAAFVQIVTFDGENIKEYNSEAIFVQDAYNLRRKLYERLKS